MGRKRRDSGEKKKELWGKRIQKMGISTKHMLVRTSHGGEENKKVVKGLGYKYDKIRNHVEK